MLYLLLNTRSHTVSITKQSVSCYIALGLMLYLFLIIMIYSTQRHGYGSMVFEDKSSYTGDWQYGLRHGQGEYVMADGSVYRGQWTNDKPHGKGTLSIPVSKYNYTGEFAPLSPFLPHYPPLSPFLHTHW